MVVAAPRPAWQSARRSGALGCLLALVGQRRGQRSALRYLAYLNGRPCLSCAVFPGWRWLSGHPPGYGSGG